MPSRHQLHPPRQHPLRSQAYPLPGPGAGRYGLLGLARCWASSYLCNLAGALLLVGLMLGGDVYHGRSDFVVQ
jgi:hypothetical protein